MGKRKTPKYYTHEEALVADIAAGRPLNKVTIDEDGMFPKLCAMIAGKAIPLAAASDGAKLLRSGDLLGAVRWIADQMEAWTNRLLDDDPEKRDKGLWEDATKALQLVGDLRTALDKGNVGQACLSSVSLGVQKERLRCRSSGFDGDVRRVKTTTRKLRAGAMENTHSPEEIARAVRDWKKLHKADPKQKLGLIDKEVADLFKVTDRTIRKWRKKTS